MQHAKTHLCPNTRCASNKRKTAAKSALFGILLLTKTRRFWGNAEDGNSGALHAPLLFNGNRLQDANNVRAFLGIGNVEVQAWALDELLCTYNDWSSVFLSHSRVATQKRLMRNEKPENRWTSIGEFYFRNSNAGRREKSETQTFVPPSA